MVTLFRKNACLHELNGSSLAQVFRPICGDLQAVQERLAETLGCTTDASVREIVDYLLESPGKRVRPALVLLSARAACGTGNGSPRLNGASINVAAAAELIHMASLVHDDLIDGATVRHHRASIQAKWGQRVSVAVGDHLCAKAFQLVADCADPRLFAILGAQLRAMCEGEIEQVVGRGDFGFSERRCLALVEKKTAALFGACCGAGAATTVGEPRVWKALQEFGFHFGIAFQILDDCKDLLSDQERLGKTPGQDVLAGDVTLPLLYAVWHCCRQDEEPLPLSRHACGDRELARIGVAFHSSPAPGKIRQLIGSYVARAQQQLQSIIASDCRDSLHQLADHLVVSMADVLVR